jgi:hypothetical protein
MKNFITQCVSETLVFLNRIMQDSVSHFAMIVIFIVHSAYGLPCHLLSPAEHNAKSSNQQ